MRLMFIKLMKNILFAYIRRLQLLLQSYYCAFIVYHKRITSDWFQN